MFLWSRNAYSLRTTCHLSWRKNMEKQTKWRTYLGGRIMIFGTCLWRMLSPRLHQVISKVRSFSGLGSNTDGLRFSRMIDLVHQPATTWEYYHYIQTTQCHGHTLCSRTASSIFDSRYKHRTTLSRCTYIIFKGPYKMDCSMQNSHSNGLLNIKWTVITLNTHLHDTVAVNYSTLMDCTKGEWNWLVHAAQTELFKKRAAMDCEWTVFTLYATKWTL